MYGYTFAFISSCNNLCIFFNFLIEEQMPEMSQRKLQSDIITFAPELQKRKNFFYRRKKKSRPINLLHHHLLLMKLEIDLCTVGCRKEMI